MLHVIAKDSGRIWGELRKEKKRYEYGGSHLFSVTLLFSTKTNRVLNTKVNNKLFLFFCFQK